MDIERELRRNVKDLQEQLNRAHKRIKTLQDALHAQKTAAKYESKFKSGMSGWAMMDDPDHR